MTEPFHGSAQRMDRTPPQGDSRRFAVAVLGTLVCIALIALVINGGWSPKWLTGLVFVGGVVWLAWATVYLCRRPEDTPNPTDQEPGYLP